MSTLVHARSNLELVLPTLLVLSSVSVQGCTCGAFALPEETARAREFRPPPGKASLYVLRGDGMRMSCYRVTGDRHFEALADGQTKTTTFYAELGNDSFCVFHVDPGHRVFSVQLDRQLRTMKYEAQAGICHFFHFGLNLDTWASYFGEIDGFKGRDLVSRYNHVATRTTLSD